MAADTKPNIKQFRVDNWAVFFLQRLQLLFAKGDHCDLTLKFHTGEELKVHTLMLNTCTTYFETLECTDSTINLPEKLSYNSLHPIINFLYSGRLEFKPELFDDLLNVSKELNITILSQLLVAQNNDNGAGSTAITVSKGEIVKKMPVKSPLNTRLHKVNAGKTVEGKKLPIWRPRTTLPLFRQFKRKYIEEDDDPKPTRFDWPVDDTTNNLIIQSPSFASLSYESTPVFPSPVSTPSPPSQSVYKRRIITSAPTPLPDKFFKSNNSKDDTNLKIEVRPADVSDDDDDGHFETLHTYGDSDDDVPQEVTINQLKPILKPSSEMSNATPNKKVRFSLIPEEKEIEKNDVLKEDNETIEIDPKTFVLPGKSEKAEPVSNHAKIIAEVLKKYPELVKNNKNIKLKITAPGLTNKANMISMTTKKSSQGKSSYVVIKSSLKPKDAKEEPFKNADKTGPWICSTSTCIEADPQVKFDSYYDYRKHLEIVHNERIDSRICEYCGYKASKRNLLLFHLYTKHDVPPPKDIKFPKCDQCCYVALSEGLLTKHLNSHQISKDLTCSNCNIIFKTVTSLQAHTCKVNTESKSNTCPYCKKKFKTQNSFKVHIKICPEKDNEEANIFDDVEAEDSSRMDMIEVPIIETVKVSDSIVELPSGLILTDQPDVALLPSSESEALSNVASGIATSIGLTVALPQDHQQAVILLDGHSEFFIQEHNPEENAEYLVPGIIDNTQIYSTPYVTSENECTVEPVNTEETEDPKPGTSKKITQYGRKENNLEINNYSIPDHRISLETPVIFDNELENEVIDVQEGVKDVENKENETNETVLTENIDTNGVQEVEEVKEQNEVIHSKSVQNEENQDIEMKENETIQVENEPKQVENEPIQVENEPIQVENEPIQVENEPMEVENEPMEVENEPIEVENDPLEQENESAEKDVEPTNAKGVDNKSIQAEYIENESNEIKVIENNSQENPINVDSTSEDTPDIEKSEEDIPEDDTNEVPNSLTAPEMSKEDEIVKANTLVKDWGFDNDDSSDEIVEESENKTDPDIKPCRINEDL